MKKLISIDSLFTNSKVVLAPLAGVTDYAYRQLVREIGCGLMVTEMISAKALVYGDKKTWKLMEISEYQRPISVQIFGSEPEFMAQAARIVEEEIGPEIIDVNMGCPVPKIVNNGEGSALMKTPKLAAEIVSAMVAAVEAPISVKMRAGFNNIQLNAPQVAQAVVDAGASMVAVHGRTREQFYSGKANWDIIARVKESVSVPVVGNGDIFTPYDAAKMLEETGCDAVMVGRGSQGNPWLCHQINTYLNTGHLPKTPSLAERFKVMKYHLQLAIDNKGEYTGVREMRSHLAWYVKGLRHAASFRQQLYQKTCYDDVCALLDKYYQSLGGA